MKKKNNSTNSKLWVHIASTENNQGGEDIFSNAEVPLGIWTSVGVTYAWTDVVFYINGVASGAHSSRAPKNIVRGNCWIGRGNNWLVRGFEGPLDVSEGLLDAALNELKIFNTALSAAYFLTEAYSFYFPQGKLFIKIFVIS